MKKFLGGLGISQKNYGGVPEDDANFDFDDLISEFVPPANDFYNQAARLSCWSRSMAGGEEEVGAPVILDGHSSDGSNDVSIRKLSDNDSFNGSQRSGANSIAGLSRGSASSAGGRGIRNFLGSKF